MQRTPTNRLIRVPSTANHTAPNNHAVDINMDQADLISLQFDEQKESRCSRIQSTSAKLLAIIPSAINTAANATGASTAIMTVSWFAGLTLGYQVKTVAWFGASMRANLYVAGDYLKSAKTLVGNIISRCRRTNRNRRIRRGEEHDGHILLSSIPTTIAVVAIGYEGFFPLGLLLFDATGAGVVAIVLSLGASSLFYATRVGGVQKLYLKIRGRKDEDVHFTRELADKLGRLKQEFIQRANNEVEKAFILDALNHIPIIRGTEKELLDLEEPNPDRYDAHAIARLSEIYNQIKEIVEREDFAYDGFIQSAYFLALPFIIRKAIIKAKENYQANKFNPAVKIIAAERINDMLESKESNLAENHLFRSKTTLEKYLPHIGLATAVIYAITCNPVFAEKFLGVVYFGVFPAGMWAILGETLASPSAALYASAALETPRNLLNALRTLDLTEGPWHTRLRNAVKGRTLAFAFDTTCNVISGGGMQNVAEKALTSPHAVQTLPRGLISIIVPGTTAGATTVNANSFFKIEKLSGKPGVQALSISLERANIIDAIPRRSYLSKFSAFFPSAQPPEEQIRLTGRTRLPRSPSSQDLPGALRRLPSFRGV